jgi:hypothetical protein
MYAKTVFAKRWISAVTSTWRGVQPNLDTLPRWRL